MILLALTLAQVPLQRGNCAKAAEREAMLTCAQADFNRAEAAMTAQWRVSLKAVGDRDREITRPAVPMRDGLLQSQRAWIAFREAQCSLEASHSFGGWGEDLDDLTCRTRMAQERTQTLKRFSETL